MSSSHPADPAPGIAPPGQDWAARLTGIIGTGVELVRDKSVRPAFIAAAAIVVALSVSASAVGLVVLVAVGLARLFNDLVFSGRMWATYCLVGGIFALAGAFIIVLGDRVTRGEP